MFEKDKMEAEASDNSHILQARGDITVYEGTRMVEIMEAIDYQIDRRVPQLILQHAPKIFEEQNKIVNHEVSEFKNDINRKLTEVLDKVNTDDSKAIERFLKKATDSNFQYLLNSSVETIVRHKDKAPKELLANLLISKIDEENDDDNYVIDEMIESLKFLSKNHINFISFAHLIRSINLNKDVLQQYQEIDSRVDIGDEEKENLKRVYSDVMKKGYQRFLNYFISQNPKEINVEYLESKGYFSGDLKSYIESTSKIILSKLNIQTSSDGESKTVLKENLPELDILINLYGFDDINKISPVTQKAIILANQNFQILHEKKAF